MMKKALNQTEVLEPQDPKPASRASSGRPTPRLALKFGLGASLKMPNLHPPKRMVYNEAVPVIHTIRELRSRLQVSKNGA
jgi:hypothetical protein